MYGTARFSSSEDRDLALLLTNGRPHFLWWAAIGDDFHLTQANVANSPVGPGTLDVEHRQCLLALLPELKSAMDANLVFKRNAGKNIGNYNLAKCRHVTDKADKIWLQSRA